MARRPRRPAHNFALPSPWLKRLVEGGMAAEEAGNVSSPELTSLNLTSVASASSLFLAHLELKRKG